MDKNLTNLLKWSIEHSAPSTGPRGVTNPPSDSNNTTSTPAPSSESTTTTTAGPAPSTTTSSLNPDILSALLGGPSDADLMRAAIDVINDPSTTLDNKLIAFDNFEQLIESLDNANNLEPLSLWTPLITLLSHPSEPELRRMAAWCVGTAVQNNVRSQERFLAMGGLGPLVELVLKEEEERAVRKKAIYALSSAVRNYQPAMDAAMGELRKRGHEHEGAEKVDAADMDAVDGVIGGLRKRVEEGLKA